MSSSIGRRHHSIHFALKGRRVQKHKYASFQVGDQYPVLSLVFKENNTKLHFLEGGFVSKAPHVTVTTTAYDGSTPILSKVRL